MVQTSKKLGNKRDRVRVANKVRGLDFAETNAWQALDALSSNTIIDTIEVFEDEIQFREKKFEGPIVVHVTLHYGKGDDSVVWSETFPGRFEGTFDNRGVSIRNVEVDTSSFYE